MQEEREGGSAGLARVLVPELPLADNFAIFPSGTDRHSSAAPDFQALYPKQAFGLHQTEARHDPADGTPTTVPRASNKHSVARLTADAPCHPSRTLPLVAPIQQEVARESRRPLCYIKKAGMKGQGEVRMKGQGEARMKGQGEVRRVEACLGMSGHVGTCPGRGRCRQAPEMGQQPSQPIRSRHEALTVQSGADTEPLDTNHR